MWVVLKLIDLSFEQDYTLERTDDARDFGEDLLAILDVFL
jgi:hypothetical protein